MWFLLTIICAMATLVAVAYYGSLAPALLFLAGAIVFAMLSMRKSGRRR
jgi:hypothetical protein